MEWPLYWLVLKWLTLLEPRSGPIRLRIDDESEPADADASPSPPPLPLLPLLLPLPPWIVMYKKCRDVNIYVFIYKQICGEQNIDIAVASSSRPRSSSPILTFLQIFWSLTLLDPRRGPTRLRMDEESEPADAEPWPATSPPLTPPYLYVQMWRWTTFVNHATCELYIQYKCFQNCRNYFCG